MKKNTLPGSSTYPDGHDKNEDTLSNSGGYQVIALIVSIRKNIFSNNGRLLGEDLNAFSAFFRIQSDETEGFHNERIRQLIGGLIRNTTDNHWDTPIEITGVLRNIKGEVIESTEKLVVPDVQLILRKPIFSGWKSR